MSHLLRGILKALFRQRFAFWAVVLGALALATAASVLPTPVWRARATIQVPQSMGDPDGAGLLNSRDLHRQVVAKLGPQTLYPGLGAEEATDAFGRDLDSQPALGNSLRVTFDGRDPATATRALEVLLGLFGDERVRLAGLAHSGTLDQQAALYRAALDEARKRLDAYRQANKVWSGEEERRLLLHQRSEIESDLKRTINDINEMNARMRSLKMQMGQVPSTVEQADLGNRYKVVDEARSRLLELQLKEQELRAKYKDDSQFVVTVRDEIGRVQSFLAEMSAAVDSRNKPSANEVFVELTKDLMRAETQLKSAEGRRDALEIQLPEIDRKMIEMNAGASQLRQLEQAVSAGEADLRRIDEARVGRAVEAGQGGGVVVMEKPSAPVAPEWPDPTLYFLLALPLGLLGGIGLALLAEACTATFAGPQEVERRLGLPVLAVLPLRRALPGRQ